MKVYSIGRETGCDIVMNDNTNVISRRHATLTVMPFGKMTIMDQSHNGTYVNGIRIQPNVPYPVSRKDNVSFAHVAPLDWSRVPNAQMAIVKYVVIGILSVLLLALLVWGGVKIFSKSASTTGSGAAEVEVPTMPSTETTDKANEEEKAKQTEEEIRKKAEADAQSRAMKRKEKSAAEGKKSGGEAKKNDKKADTPKEDKAKDTPHEESTSGPGFGM